MENFMYVLPYALCLGFLLILIYSRYRSDLDQIKNKHTIRALESTIEDLRKQLSSTQNHSQELTDFLTDMNQKGYSFVRVEPNSVILRSPRG